ncbi:MAG: YihY/virulence factor BrkB family protein [Solirubrobacteraceae bacterium]
MRRIGNGLKHFYVKAYTDNLTGLAGMVAYSLLLSIFPVALIALFVAGQVLASPQLEISVLADLQKLFPSATATTLSRALREIRGSSTTVGIVAFIASLWVATSFWGALDTAFCRIYGVPCRSWVRQKLFGLGMLGLVLLFFAATVAIPTVQSLLFSRSADLPFGLSGREALWAISLGAGFVINFAALATIYRTVPNTPVAWLGVWPGALGATVAIFCIDYGFPFYLTNVSTFGGLRTTLVFILIVLLWFYLLALIILAGAVVNELRLVGHRSDTLAAMPDPTTEGMRIEQLQRERDEHARAKAASDEPETEQHERRAERASYLEEKLTERGEAEDAAQASLRADVEPAGREEG